VKQLDDISFEEEPEIEEVKCLKRLPNTVLTEDTLKEYCGKDLEKLNIENHYWIKDEVIDKIGKLSPNLIVRQIQLICRNYH
jgi:hypothetical protein